MNLNTLSVPQIQRRSSIASILGRGLALPKFAIDQSDSALIAQQLHLTTRWHDALPALYRKSGVARRGSVLLENEETDLAVRQSFYKPASIENPHGPSTAARMKAYARHAGPLLQSACGQAISEAHIKPKQLTHLITVSCTGFQAPGVDFDLIRRLGLDPSIQRTHVGFMGCHAALNAMRIAKSIVEADRNACVLIGAVELCSLHQQYTDDAQQLVANALFADGAAGMVLGTCDDIEATSEGESISNWQIVATGSTILAETCDMMSWTIGDHGFYMSLAPQVPSLIEQYLRSWLEAWLAEHFIQSLDEIDAWAVHPGGPRIVQAAGQALGLDGSLLAPSLATLHQHGNMSSPTILFILDRISTDNTTSKTCLMIAFGPGLCIEVALLERGGAGLTRQS